MITTQTIVDRIEIIVDGSIFFRLGLQVLQDGVLISNNWHRSAIEPGTDVDAQVAAVNNSLTQLGRDLMTADDVNRLKAVVATIQTPDVVTAYQTAVAAAEAAAVQVSTTPPTKS